MKELGQGVQGAACGVPWPRVCDLGALAQGRPRLCARGAVPCDVGCVVLVTQAPADASASCPGGASPVGTGPGQGCGNSLGGASLETWDLLCNLTSECWRMFRNEGSEGGWSARCPL